jgi:ATP-binding protein involved in chromosome partitioning
MRKIAERTLLIGAGKGGVGKSTLTVNVAVSLAASGKNVGILDADLYGPSLPIMMGLRNLSPRARQDGSVIPFTKFGVLLISLGFFLEEARSIVWRGPMLHGMLEKFLVHVAWPPLDYLLVDLPPGTGDVLVSLSQLLNIEGSLVVTTPQEVAFLDVIKAVNAFDQLKIQTCGLIENMVGVPFGGSRGKSFAERLSLPFLGAIPLNEHICRGSDEGIPYAFATPSEVIFSPLADRIQEILNGKG